MTHAPRNPLAGTVYTKTLRDVRCIRLSVLTDETTSPERQREADDLAAAAHNISFGEGDQLREAVDLDVSASKISPFDRPALGGWLARPDDFDALAWWRFDRAIRSMADMHKLAEWAREHRKVLVFAEGIGGGKLVFDFRNPLDLMAELQMTMFALPLRWRRRASATVLPALWLPSGTCRIGGAAAVVHRTATCPEGHRDVSHAASPLPVVVARTATSRPGTR